MPEGVPYKKARKGFAELKLYGLTGDLAVSVVTPTCRNDGTLCLETNQLPLILKKIIERIVS